MDSNALRFWMISSQDEWLLGRPSPELPSGVRYCESRRRLQLRSSPISPPPAENFATAVSLLDAVPFARDAFGNYARWDPVSGQVLAGGSGPGEVPIYAPPPQEAATDLALGYDGVLYVAIAGRLVFIDRMNRWPIHTLDDPGVRFWRLVPHPEGGVLALDRDKPQLVRVEGLPLGDLPPRPAAPGVLRAPDDNQNPPRIAVISPLPNSEYFVGVAEDGGGKFAVLSWSRKDPANDAVWLRTFSSIEALGVAQRVMGLKLPYALAWLDGARVALLATETREAFIYDVDPAAATLPPAGDTYIVAGVNTGPFAHGFGLPPYYGNGRDIVPLLPLSLNSFSASGTARNQRRIDSGTPLATWHRLHMEAVMPPRCGAVVWLAASDDWADLDKPDTPWYPHLFGDVAALADYPEAPRATWLRVPSEVPFHPGLLDEPPRRNRSGLFMALVQRANVAVRRLRGRYLGMKVALFGDQRSTPEIAAIRVYGPRFSYVDHYLPEIYREDTFGPEEDLPARSTRPDFFERFVDIFEAEMTRIEDCVASSYLLTDSRSTPEDSIDWLGSWIGVAPEAEAPDRRRARVTATPRLYRERGTIQGITDALDISTNGLCSRGAVVLIEDYRLRHTFATVLGSNLDIRDDPLLPGRWESANSFVGDTLFLGEEHKREFLSLFERDIRSATEQSTVREFYLDLANRLTVFVHDQVEAVDQQLVMRVVEREKPAHVAAAYRRATQPFLVGIASLLGANTYLAPAPPRQLARIDQSRAGRWAFIGHLPTLDPRLDDNRTAAELEKPVARITAPHVVLVGQPIALDGSASVAPAGSTITHFQWTILPNS